MNGVVILKHKVFLAMAAGVLGLAILFSGPSWAGEEGGRVFDQAGLFDGAETRELEETLRQARSGIHMDLAVVTVSDTGGKASSEYADWFYLDGGFGTGKKKSGALFLIDMDNREIYLSSSGDMIRFLTDARVDQILDDAYAYAADGDYYEAAHSFIVEVETYYRKGIESGQYNFDSETGEISRHRAVRWYEALLALAAAGASASFACLRVKKEYSMERERGQALNYRMAYRAAAAFALAAQADRFLDKHVTQMAIPRGGAGGRPGGGAPRGRSTTHSTGGHTFGGGGRKF